MTDKKKPSASKGKQPGKKPTRNHLTTEQRYIHRRIAEQSAHSLAGGRNWHPEEYPALWKLLQAAKQEASSRARLRGRIVFTYEGKPYAVRFTNLDRIKVEDRQTGDLIAQTGPFQF